MGWDWKTYNDQPLFFIELINMFRVLESKENDRQQKM